MKWIETQKKNQGTLGLLIMVIRLESRTLESSMDLCGPFLSSHSEMVRKKMFAYLVVARKLHNSDLQRPPQRFGWCAVELTEEKGTLHSNGRRWVRLVAQQSIPFPLALWSPQGKAMLFTRPSGPGQMTRQKRMTLSVFHLLKNCFVSEFFLKDSTMPTGRDIFKSCVPT